MWKNHELHHFKQLFVFQESKDPSRSKYHFHQSPQKGRNGIYVAWRARNLVVSTHLKNISQVGSFPIPSV